MGRSPCCDSDANVKKGPWTTEEDDKLRDYIEENGGGNWRNLPKLAGLNRCGKSCRLRWQNYLRPDIKRGMFTDEEEQIIIQSHSVLGNKWSAIAAKLPGRTDNEIKNYWNTNLRKKLLKMGIDPVTHAPRTDIMSIPNLMTAAATLNNLTSNPLINALQFPQLQLLQTLIQVVAANSTPQNLLQSACINGAYNALYNNIPPISTSSTPSLVSASPETSNVDQVQEEVKASNISVSSPTSKPLDTWDDLSLDDLGWKDILNHISWSDGL